jgi:hypothetical protein
VGALDAQQLACALNAIDRFTQVGVRPLVLVPQRRCERLIQ